VKKTLFATAFALLGAFAFSQEQTAIAVFPFDDRANILSRDESDLFYRAVINEFFIKSEGDYFVVPRQVLRKFDNTIKEFQSDGYLLRLRTSEMFEVFTLLSVTYILFVQVGNNTNTTVIFDDGWRPPDNIVNLFFSLYTYPELKNLTNVFNIAFSNDELFTRIHGLVESMMEAIAEAGAGEN
jgi:hypothetical protein